jgi:hypothetical protein
MVTSITRELNPSAKKMMVRKMEQLPFHKAILIAAALLLSAAILSCDNSTSAETKYSVSGTITKTGLTNGLYAYLKIVVNGGASDSPTLYSTRSTAFSGGTATYSLSGIAAGTYTGYAFIDVNGNISPDAGDFVTDGGGQITVSANVTNQDIPNEAWVLIQ